MCLSDFAILEVLLRKGPHRSESSATRIDFFDQRGRRPSPSTGWKRGAWWRGPITP